MSLSLSLAQFAPSPIGYGIVPAFDLDAAYGTTIATGVSSWTDRTGLVTFLQATGANQPLPVITGPSGRAALSFNGSSQFMSAAAAVLPLQNWTVFLVLQFSGPAGYSFALSNMDNGGNKGWEIGDDSAHNRAILLPNVGTVEGSVATASWELWALTNNGITNTLTVNGANQSLSGATSQPLSGGTGSTVGGRSGGSLFMKGQIARIIGYASVLSAGQLTQVTNFLLNWYNL
jgi:hypothetical protein